MMLSRENCDVCGQDILLGSHEGCFTYRGGRQAGMANTFGPVTEYKQELDRITNPKQEVRVIDPIIKPDDLRHGKVLTLYADYGCRCDLCVKIWRDYQRQYRQLHPRNKRRHNKLRNTTASWRRKALDELKLSSGCVDCGYKKNACALDFDHVKGEKSGNISSMLKNVGWDKVLIEVDKCEVVCANCHRIRSKEFHPWTLRK